MNWFDGFNKIITYIEEHLDTDIDNEKIADILGYSVYHCQRLFMMVAGVSLADYIRARRLSKAAEELIDGSSKVVDVAMKYGYSSPNSFQRAFKNLHGITPNDVKKGGVEIKVFPPLSFELNIKGAEAMKYTIKKVEAFRVVGIKIHTTMENGESYKTIPALWQGLAKQGGPGKILALMDSEPMGLLGISDYNPTLHSSEFDYYIAVSSKQEVPEEMVEFKVPACTWAIFTCTRESVEEIQSIQQRMVMEWLPSSGYEFANAPDIELSYPDGRMDLWLPIVKKQ